MSKPDDIPQDVWDAAMPIAVEMEAHAAVGTRTDAKAAVIAPAILAERNRIVALIPQFVDQITAEDIAAAIRKGGE